MKNKLMTRERMRKDASYFPHKYICKKCGTKYGSDSQNDSGICKLCIDYSGNGRKRK